MILNGKQKATPDLKKSHRQNRKLGKIGRGGLCVGGEGEGGKYTG